MRVALLSDTNTISNCWTWYGALLSDTETISGCWTWYATDVYFSFFITPLSESPCYQNLKQYQNAGLGMVQIFFCIFNLTEQCESPRHQTLKQNPVAGLGMLLKFTFFFCHSTIRVAVFLNFKKYLVAGLGLVRYWYFFSFFVTPISDSLCY